MCSYDVSTPGSKNYGNHLNNDEVCHFISRDLKCAYISSKVNSFLSPRLESVTAVKSYLASHGVSVEQASLAGDWLSISVPVSKANEIFQANYEVFNVCILITCRIQ